MHAALHPLASPSVEPKQSIATVIGYINKAIKNITPRGPFIVICQWIRPQPNTGASKFFTVTLADHQQSEIAIQGIIWDAATIQRLLADGQRYGMDLQDRNARCEVVLEVSIDCWVKKASPYLRIHRLNEVGMTGLKQQAKEAAIKALTDLGLLTTNKSKPWPLAPRRIALVTKPDSAACEDALSVLKRSGFAFIPTVIPVSVQGAHAEQSLLTAFRTIDATAHAYDLVLLIRGGGSELDLTAYDRMAVAEAVARCPLPVITGLGHQIDHSVCDIVSNLAVETPTAAAMAAVKHLQNLQDTIASIMTSLLGRTQRQLTLAHQRLTATTGPILRRSLSRIHQTLQQTEQLATRILQQHGQGRLHAGTQQLAARLYGIRTATVNTHLTPRRHRLHQGLNQIHVQLHTRLHTRRTQLSTLVTGIQSLDPARLMGMGFCYLTSTTGDLIRSPAMLTPQCQIHIHFHDQTIPAIITTQEPSHDHQRLDPRDHSNPPAQPRRRLRRTPTHRTSGSNGSPAA